MGGNYRNAEGYADPTAGEAITQVIKENRTYKPLVYICSQFSGDIVGNTEKAKQYSRFAVDADVIPIAPHLLLPLYMKETEEGELAMFMDMVILGRCEEWSGGMQAEIDKVKKRRMKIRYFSEDCKEDS